MNDSVIEDSNITDMIEPAAGALRNRSKRNENEVSDEAAILHLSPPNAPPAASASLDDSGGGGGRSSSRSATASLLSRDSGNSTEGSVHSLENGAAIHHSELFYLKKPATALFVDINDTDDLNSLDGKCSVQALDIEEDESEGRKNRDASVREENYEDCDGVETVKNTIKQLSQYRREMSVQVRFVQR